MRAALLAAAAAANLATLPVDASAQTSPTRQTSACAIYAHEAAQRSGLPVETVLRVMRAESANNPRAVSRAGAMGCMQIMPGTWGYLTRRHRLGGDPFDPRMNMIGGALYLAELAARYGFPGAYSAYNAGPGRYERHVAGGARLPAETIAYTAHLSGTAQVSGASRPQSPAPVVARWQEANLFVSRSAGAATNADDAPSSSVREARQLPATNVRAPTGLFPFAPRGETTANAPVVAGNAGE